MSKKELDIKVHVQYNEHGKSFEDLLAEGIRQANLQAIREQIIASTATSEKEVPMTNDYQIYNAALYLRLSKEDETNGQSEHNQSARFSHQVHTGAGLEYRGGLH